MQFNTLADYLGRLLTWDTAMMLCVWILLAVLLRKPISKALNLQGSGLFWSVAPLIGILTMSLRVYEANGTADVFWLFDSFAWSQSMHHMVNWLLNAVLYLPAAFFLVVNGKRWWLVLASLVFLSATIETVQTFTRFGVGDPADFVANSYGAVFGILFAWIYLWIAGLVRRFF